jgi:molybdopterin adenylyltransferase
VRVGRVTVSDRASGGIYEDISGPEIERVLRASLAEPIEFERVLLPD